jgi:hypothetical protein
VNKVTGSTSKRSTVFIISMLLVLICATALLAWANYRNNGGGNPEELRISSAGSDIVLQREELFDLELREFRTIMNTSSGSSDNIDCEGASLRSLLEHAGIPFRRTSTISAHGADGYVATYSGAEVEDESIYLVLFVDGVPLEGRKAGGMGPFMTVVRRDQFAQRWCKYLTEIRVDK